MNVRIIWLGRNMVQVRELVGCQSDKERRTFFTMYSPIYYAIENGSFILDLGEFGKHAFKIEPK